MAQGANARAQEPKHPTKQLQHPPLVGSAATAPELSVPLNDMCLKPHRAGGCTDVIDSADLAGPNDLVLVEREHWDATGHRCLIISGTAA